MALDYFHAKRVQKQDVKQTEQICLTSSPGADYPMCTVCICTEGPTTLEAPTPGIRENCH